MGNKSKTQGKKQSQKWESRRDLMGARQPRATGGVPAKAQWAGKQPKAISPKVGEERRRLPVLWDSSRRGTLRAAP